MKYNFLYLFLCFLFCSCGHSQTPVEEEAELIGGPCEGCEAVFEFGDRSLDPVDSLPGFGEEGQAIKISGTIYQQDGNTPAENVILYVYHTNQEGIYPTKGDEKGWAKRHGYIRGWMKTGKSGNYTFYTSKPGAYPNRSNPEHIHAILLEPNGKYYYIQDYHFKGDSLLTERQKNPSQPRGGTNGLLELENEDGLWVGKRDIILGRNVPGY